MKKSTKYLASGIVLSLGWFILAACDCDDTKESNFPGLWVACVNNKPTLMEYSGDSPKIVSSVPAGNFDPKAYDCSHPGSPQYQDSESGAPFPVSSYGGPAGYARQHPNTTSSTSTGPFIFQPQQYRDLPFVPHIPVPDTPPPCDSTYPDVFQTVHTNAMVTRFHSCPFTVVASIPVQTRPLQIVTFGTMAYVTSFDNAVNFIDLTTNKVVYTLNTDPSINPNGIAISPDGTRLYITSFNTNFPVVEVINAQTHAVITNIQTSMVYPSGETITPDGSQLWVTSTLANGVDVIDLATNTRVTTLNINMATSVAFNSIGTRAYITSDNPNPGVAGTVVVVDTSSYKTVNTYTVGVTPADIAMSFGDKFLVVNNTDDGTVSIIDLVQGVVKSAKIGASPSGITFVH